MSIPFAWTVGMCSLPKCLDCRWHGGDPIATAYFNALSAAFPQGETFFIESVRRYRDSVQEPLRQQIAAFVPGRVSKETGAAQALYIKEAVRLALDRRIGGIVGPLPTAGLIPCFEFFYEGDFCHLTVQLKNVKYATPFNVIDLNGGETQGL